MVTLDFEYTVIQGSFILKTMRPTQDHYNRVGVEGSRKIPMKGKNPSQS